MPTDSAKGAAIVTGAAQGIGRAIAIRLAKDGYDVALNDIPAKEDMLRTVADEITSQGQKSTIVVVDVTDEQSVAEMIKKTASELGLLRVMVANAGIPLTFGTEFLDTRSEDFEKVLKVNLIGTFLCYREAARQMIQQGTWGRIIGASSLNGKRGSSHSTGYTATKFGIIGITQSAEMIKHGITVNTYAPGLIDTPMSRALSPVDPTLSEKEQTQKLVQMASASTGLALSLGTPEDVASVVSYIAPEGSKFMTGQALSVNEGAFFG